MSHADASLFVVIQLFRGCAAGHDRSNLSFESLTSLKARRALTQRDEGIRYGALCRGRGRTLDRTNQQIVAAGAGGVFSGDMYNEYEQVGQSRDSGHRG